MKAEDCGEQGGIYRTLFAKWEYLGRIRSRRELQRVLGSLPRRRICGNTWRKIRIAESHNLYDIFTGLTVSRRQERFCGNISVSLEDFQDILDAIGRFVYFDSRKIAGEKRK